MAEPRIKKAVTGHDQVVAYYKREIDRGRIAHDEKLPGRPEMARRFGCSESLIVRARRTLKEDGYIRTDHGRAVHAVGPAQRRLTAGSDDESTPANAA